MIRRRFIDVITLLTTAMLLAACSSAPTRTYSVRGPDAYYGEAQSASAKEWLLKRGIHDYDRYSAGTVSFKYGSEEIQTMDFAAFDAFVTSRLAGQTIAGARRASLTSSDGAVPNTVIYFDADGHFAQWRGPAVDQGHWWIEGVPEAEQVKARRMGAEPPARVICFQKETVSGGSATSLGLPACSSAYGQISGILGKRTGDVFNLKSGKAPGTLSEDFPRTWPDGQPLLADKAPHD